ncbi:hypothetical protein [Flavobacterium sp.]|uniref:hypothetical protein n=1 Tax=Flavobacterium sp. TaxID=239 RepID=UPI0026143867|nr:hypothetical protein [Flavobacterium sp.]
MSILKKIFFFLIGFTTLNASSQDIDNIILNFNSERRIPFNSVKVRIYKREDGNSAFAFVSSRPLKDDPRWNYSKIDTIYDIEIQQFNKLKDKLSSLDKINLDKAFRQGFGGSTCTLEFGAKGRNTSYAFWISKSDSKERGLLEFVEICEEILKLVYLDSKEILGH